MIQRVISVTKNAGWYFLPQVIGFVINMYVTRVYSIYLTAEAFSIIGFFQNIETNFLFPFFGVVWTNNYTASYFARTVDNNREELRSTYVSLLIINIPLGALFLIATLVAEFYSFLDFSLFPFVIISLLYTYFSIHRTMLLADLKMKNKGCLYCFISLLFYILSSLIGVVLVSCFAMQAEGKLLGMLVAGIFIFVVITVIYIKEGILEGILMHFSLKRIFLFSRKVYRKYYPILLSSLLTFPAFYVDKWFLATKGNLQEMALYNLGDTFSGYISLFFSALYMAIEPDIYKYATNGNRKKIIALFLFFLLLYSCVNVVAVTLAEPVCSFMTRGVYVNSFRYFRILCWGNMIMLLSYFLGIVLVVRNCLKPQMWFKIFLSVVSVSIFSGLVFDKFLYYAYVKIALFALHLFVLIFFVFLTRNTFVRKIEAV